MDEILLFFANMRNNFFGFFTAYLNDSKPTRYIVGSYQSSEFINYSYDMSVDGEGNYTILFNNNIYDSGQYEQISDYTYFFQGEKDFLVNLYKEKFYYYDEDNSRIIEFIKKSSIPMVVEWFEHFYIKNVWVNCINLFKRY